MTGFASSSAASSAIRSARGRLGELDLEPLALADPCDLIEAEPAAGAGDGLALRVVDLRLQHHVDDESGHIPNSTRASSRRMRVGMAAAWQ